MRKRFPGLVAALLFAAIVFVTGKASAQAVQIQNQSDWAIEYLFLSLTGDSQWGPDQLGEYVLYTGQWVRINAPCAYYDLRVVDEDGDDCVVSNIHLCNEVVNISNSDLLTCQGDTQVYGAMQGGAAATCGLGFELVFVVPPVIWLRGRRLGRSFDGSR